MKRKDISSVPLESGNTEFNNFDTSSTLKIRIQKPSLINFDIIFYRYIFRIIEKWSYKKSCNGEYEFEVKFGNDGKYGI